MLEEISGQPSSESFASKACHTIIRPLDLAASSLPSPRLSNCYHTIAISGEEALLVNSPYTCHPHLLHLESVGKPQRLLAKALTVMAPIRDDYATAPYIDAFNWSSVVSALKSLVVAESYEWKHQSYYIVVFRSQVPLSTNRSHLAALDKRSHAEAMESGGLLKYWFGTPDVNGRNMATCKPHNQSAYLRRNQLSTSGIWRDRGDAKRGSIGQGHEEARRATINMYSEWKLERLTLEIGVNVESWTVVDYEE